MVPAQWITTNKRRIQENVVLANGDIVSCNLAGDVHLTVRALNNELVCLLLPDCRSAASITEPLISSDHLGRIGIAVTTLTDGHQAIGALLHCEPSIIARRIPNRTRNWLDIITTVPPQSSDGLTYVQSKDLPKSFRSTTPSAPPITPQALAHSSLGPSQDLTHLPDPIPVAPHNAAAAARTRVAPSADDIRRVAHAHRCLGHVGLGHLAQSSSNHSFHVPSSVVRRVQHDWFCEVCASEKAQRVPHSRSAAPVDSPRPLYKLHVDVVTHFPVSEWGDTVALTILDDFTRFVSVYPLHSKSEVADALRRHILTEERRFQDKDFTVSVLHSDQGTEFAPLRSFFADRGIEHWETVRHSSSSNGKVERVQQELSRVTRALMADAGFASADRGLWPLAIRSAAYILNARVTNLGPPCAITRYLGRVKKKDYLHPWGCVAYALVEEHEREHRLASRGAAMMLLGFDPHGMKGWLLGTFRDGQWKTLWVRNVQRWDDAGRYTSLLSKSEGSPAVSPEPVQASSNLTNHEGTARPRRAAAQRSQERTHELIEEFGRYKETVAEARAAAVSTSHAASADTSSHHLIETGIPTPLGTGGDALTFTDIGGDLVTPTALGCGSAISSGSGGDQLSDALGPALWADPVDGREALRRPDGAAWRAAMQEEIDTLYERGVFESVERPLDVVTLRGRFVTTYKVRDGCVLRRRARFVAQGFNQRPGRDYDPDALSSPTARLSVIRTVLALGSRLGWACYSFDIVSAYLYADLQPEEYVYMEQPSGFSSGPHQVWQVVKALYGLKQSARRWFECFSGILHSLGFTHCQSDPCVFYRTHGSDVLILAVWVDDVAAVTSSKGAYAGFLEELQEHVAFKDGGELSYFLGIRFQRHRGALFASQRDYILQRAALYGRDDCAPHVQPLRTGTRLKPGPTLAEGAQVNEVRRYQSEVGALGWIAMCTRPDVTFAVNQLQQVANNPLPDHWDALEHLWGYVVHTAHLCLRLQPTAGPPLLAFSDSSYGSEDWDGKATSGSAVYVFGCLVDWKAGKQDSVVGRSTGDSEYVAAAQTTKVAAPLRELAEELGSIKTGWALPILCDSSVAVRCANNVGSAKGTKHLQRAWHSLREDCRAGVIRMVKVAGKENLADQFTKALPRPTLTTLRDRDVVPWPQPRL